MTEAVWSRAPENVLREAALSRLPDVSEALFEARDLTPELERMRTMLRHLSAAQRSAEAVLDYRERETADC